MREFIGTYLVVFIGWGTVFVGRLCRGLQRLNTRDVYVGISGSHSRPCWGGGLRSSLQSFRYHRTRGLAGITKEQGPSVPLKSARRCILGSGNPH